MTLVTVIRANLFRRPTRTVLTLLSITIAFMLFVLLRSISNAFSGEITLAGVDRLVVAPKYSIVDPLPIKQVNQVRGLDEVIGVAQANWFGGIYQDPKNFFAKYPVVPKDWFEMFSEVETDALEVEKFQNTRTGAMAHVSLVERFGWKVGDVVPIEADIYPKADGSRQWEFELVGTFKEKPGEPLQDAFLIHQDYFEEAVQPWAKSQYGWMFVKIADPARAAEVASQIDAMFENSDNPTRTTSEAEYQRQFAKQLGNIGLIMSAIIGAVFFTIILLTANTMVQALRERIPELAVLKTLGFTDWQVSLMILAEGVALCLLGGLIGIGLSLLVEPGFRDAIIRFTGVFEISRVTIITAVLIALGLGIAVASAPALSAKRLAIADALRR
ncbi:MAG: ABC transporter permease [Pseudomonadales bacterium]